MGYAADISSIFEQKKNENLITKKSKKRFICQQNKAF
jgi:hypothetical protein